MDWNAIAGDWKQISAKLKARFTTLTDEDLQFVDRNKGALVAKVRDRTGLERDTVERQLDALIAGLVASPAAVPKPPEPVVIPPSGGAKPHGA